MLLYTTAICEVREFHLTGFSGLLYFKLLPQMSKRGVSRTQIVDRWEVVGAD